MPRVAAISIAGMDLWFWSNDHSPAHFHASRVDEWEIAVRFMSCTPNSLDFEVKWGSGPNARDRKALLHAVLARRGELLVERETTVASEEKR